jgi:paired amphipathic helix protein Sin3a
MLRICTQAHTINADHRCQELIDLLAKDREAPQTTLRHQIAYRHIAESVLGNDENIYRLEWVC